jgi:hypothetical protein
MIRPVSDEELVAFLHGELDEARAAEVEAAINDDPDLADRAERLDRQDDMVRNAFAPILAAPVPPAMAAVLSDPPEPAKVISMADARAARVEKASMPSVTVRRWGWPQMGAIAASLVVGIVTGPALIGGLGGGVGGTGGGESLIVATASGPALPPALAAMLDSAPSGEAVELAGLGTARVDITFRSLDAALCRQVQVTQAAASSDLLACRSDDGWQVEALGLRAASGGEVRTASGDAAPAVIAAVDAIIDSDPLVGAEEAAALRR